MYSTIILLIFDLNWQKQIKIVGNTLNEVTISHNSSCIHHITENEVKILLAFLIIVILAETIYHIPLKMINVDLYVTPLIYLINKSIADGVFPNSLKLAKVIPIYKSEDKSMISNCRSIYILQFFSKFVKKTYVQPLN